VLHHVEVDHEARAGRTSGGEEVEDTLGCHRGSPHRSSCRVGARPWPLRWTKDASRVASPGRWTTPDHETHDAQRCTCAPRRKRALSDLAWSTPRTVGNQVVPHR